MTKLWKLPLILTVTTLIAATGLSVVNNKTKPLIEEHKIQAIQSALKVVSPAGPNGLNLPMLNKEGAVDYYTCYANPDTTGLRGYIFTAYGVGYSSTIETMVGVDTTGTIKGIIILEQLETPGLGSKIQEVRYGESEPWFQVQFRNKTVDQLQVDKDGGSIKSITGATISSRAVTKSIREGIADLGKKIGGFPTQPKPVI